MSSDRLCGCHFLTTGGFAIGFQMVNAVIALSSTALVLDRYRTWKVFEPRVTTASPLIANTSEKLVPTRWSEAWVELAMAWYTAFASVWIFTILVACLTFRYYRPVLVVPNIIALIVGILVAALGFGVILWRILDVSSGYRTSEYEDVMLVYTMAFLAFTLVASFVYLFLMILYHLFLSRRLSGDNKGFTMTDVRPSPTSSRTQVPPAPVSFDAMPTSPILFRSQRQPPQQPVVALTRPVATTRPPRKSTEAQTVNQAPAKSPDFDSDDLFV